MNIIETLVRRIEELSLNALPALRTITYDGWVLRFADGYTKRANSVNPLYESSLPLKEKIPNCEEQYRNQKLGVVYKMTPAAQPADLDSVLAEHGYLEDHRTSVQTMSLGTLPWLSSVGVVELSQELNHKWLQNFCRMNQVHPDNQAVLERMLKNIKTLTGFALLVVSDTVVACGLGVIEGNHIGLFDIVTHPAYRGRGFGTELVLGLLKWGKDAGADTAYLQVVATNTPALRLYAKSGFKESYQYWYRIKSPSLE